MRIKVGERLPEVSLFRMGEAGPEAIASGKFFAHRRVLLFALPGAFTPICSAAHLPGFIAAARALREKGIDEIACLAMNDVYVMDAWGKAHQSLGAVTMLADGSGDFTRALGLVADLSERGFGERSQRYALIADDGVVTHLNVEAPGKFEISDAATMLGLL
ncbi:MAG: peroxiredoxin [Arenicellales bacterium]|jgi:peroxiredoxin|nr:peroxiredoxin [Arenicellales bacterium]HCV20249.1 peroxiredoxin [Gammaproteobacteria bacterium]MDP6312875.1 peroxiredoxin [Arenicellales bacterium]MDP7120547.1 peroxiredoxin [Arenicellales bacterium]MEE1557802.1 peroxiredoxin [Arenicellales bacterium]|tara:strand:- start:1572 stop:2054 length:483 start_codon:yes stop_codon:yes gene_type:complete